MTQDQVRLFLRIPGRRHGSVQQIIFGVSENPWILHGRPADHDAADGCVFLHVRYRLRGGNIPVPDDRHGHGPCAFVNDVPVGRAGILLGTGTPVNGNHGNSLILQQAARVHGAQALEIPANAYFGRDGDAVAHGFHHASGHGGQQGKVFQQGGPSIFAHHFGDRTAEVDIDEIRFLMVQDYSGGLSHVVPVRAEKLNAYGAVRVFYLRVPPVSLPCLENAFRRDELRHHDVNPQFLADGAENGVRYSGHRSQEQREIRFDKRQGSGSWAVGKSHDSLE